MRLDSRHPAITSRPLCISAFRVDISPFFFAAAFTGMRTWFTISRAQTPPPQRAPPEGLLSFPDEVFLSGVFPYLAPEDIVVLGWTSHRLHSLAIDNAFWSCALRRTFDVPEVLDAELNPPADAMLPVDHFRRLYFGLTYPRVFVWGVWDDRIPFPRKAKTVVDSIGAEVIREPVDVTDFFKGARGLHHIESMEASILFGCQDGSIWTWWSTQELAVPIRQNHVRILGLRGGGRGQNKDPATAPPPPLLVSHGPTATVFVEDSGCVKYIPNQRFRRPCQYSVVGDSTAASTAFSFEPRVVPLPPGRVEQVHATYNRAGALIDGIIYVWFFDEVERPHRLVPIPTRDTFDQWQWYQVNHGESREKWHARWAASEAALAAFQESEARKDAAAARRCHHAKTETESESESHDQNPERVVRIVVSPLRIYALKRNGEVWTMGVALNEEFLSQSWTFLPGASMPTTVDLREDLHGVVVGSVTLPEPAVTAPVPMPAGASIQSVPSRGQQVVYHLRDVMGRPYSNVDQSWTWMATLHAPVVQIAMSSLTYVALLGDGTVLSWGSNRWAALGREPGRSEAARNGLAPPGRVLFPRAERKGPPPRVFAVASRAALALGDGRLPAWLGRGHWTGAGGGAGGTATASKGKSSRLSAFDLVEHGRRLRDWWDDFKLLRDM